MRYKGFVINVHDALNLDIDIIVPKHLRRQFRTQYSNAFINGYVYKQDGEIKFGIAYRCRLKGLKKKNPTSNLNAAYIRASQIVISNELWLDCLVFGMDSYRRLIVDIIDPRSETHLCDILLTNYPDVFVKYSNANQEESPTGSD